MRNRLKSRVIFTSILACGSLLSGCFRNFPSPQQTTSRQVYQNLPYQQLFTQFNLSTLGLPFGNTADNISKIKSKPPSDKIRFVLLGDNRNSSPFSDTGNKIYAKTISTINALKPDFAVNVGDFTFDSLPRHWRDFEKVTAKIQSPYLTVVGNHDVIFRRNYYESRYTPPNPETGLDDYTFDYGNARFVMLDNANRTITERQFAWMDKLTQTSKKTFVFAHIPPALEEWKHSLSPSDSVSKRWMEISTRNHVDFVLLGHIHLFDAKTTDGVQYVVSGGAGSPLDKGSGFGRALYHVVLFEVDGDKIDYKVIPVPTREIAEGPTGFSTGLDAGEIDKLLPPEEQIPDYYFHQHR